MTGNAQDRAERTFGKLIPAVNEWFDEPPPGSAICAEFLLGRGQVALQHDGCAVVEGVGNGRFSMHPFEPVIGQWKGVEKGRTGGQRVNRRPEVMEESRQSERQGAASAAGLRLGFEDLDRQAGLGENDGGGEAVGAGADHDGALHGVLPSLRSVVWRQFVGPTNNIRLSVGRERKFGRIEAQQLAAPPVASAALFFLRSKPILP